MIKTPVKADYDFPRPILDATGQCILDVVHHACDREEVIRIINAHDDLVAAVKLGVIWAGIALNTTSLPDTCQKDIDLMNAALEKAGGQ